MSTFRRRLMMAVSQGGGKPIGIRQGPGAYIPLGYYAGPNTRVEIDIRFGAAGTATGLGGGVVGSIPDSSNNSFGVGYGGNVTQYIRSTYFTYSKKNTYKTIHLLQANDRWIITLGKTGDAYYASVTSVANPSIQTSVATARKENTDANQLILLSDNANTIVPFSQSDLVVIYSVKIYEDDVLSAEYLQDEQNGVVGLTERISQVFYPPSGGVFTIYNE